MKPTNPGTHPRIIFFISYAVPTAEDISDAGRLGQNVVFRNSSFVFEDSCLEDCDGVAGDIPKKYSDSYPHAEDVFHVSEESLENDSEEKEVIKRGRGRPRKL